MQRYATEDFSGSTSPTSLLQSGAGSASHYGSANASGHYGSAQSGGYYAGAGSGMYPSTMAIQASFLYPHLYTATMSPTHHLHLSGNPGSVDGGALDEYGAMVGVTPTGDVTGHHHHQQQHHHQHHRANPSDSQTYSSLEGDESQTGPIRGAYSARSEHGVWRPYWQTFSYWRPEFDVRISRTLPQKKWCKVSKQVSGRNASDDDDDDDDLNLSIKTDSTQTNERSSNRTVKQFGEESGDGWKERKEAIKWLCAFYLKLLLKQLKTPICISNLE